MSNEEIIKIIEAIIKRGNDVEIRRKGDGYIILEIKKQLNILLPRNWARERAIGAKQYAVNACCLAPFLFIQAKSAKQRGF